MLESNENGGGGDNDWMCEWVVRNQIVVDTELGLRFHLGRYVAELRTDLGEFLDEKNASLGMMKGDDRQANEREADGALDYTAEARGFSEWTRNMERAFEEKGSGRCDDTQRNLGFAVSEGVNDGEGE